MWFLGVVKDKDLSTILPLFPKEAMYYFTKPEISRGLPVAVLAKQARATGLRGELFESVAQAYQAALGAADSEDVIFIGGSTFVVAEVL